MQRQVAVVGKLYAGKDKDGDFKWMIKQKELFKYFLQVLTDSLSGLVDMVCGTGKDQYESVRIFYFAPARR